MTADHDSRVDELGKASRRAALLSLSGFIVVLLSLAYSAYELRRMAVKRAELLKDISKAQGTYDELKANIEKLSSLRITKENEVYELKATAKATGHNTGDGDPIYDFAIYINSPPELLGKIDKVVYEFNHPTFKQPHRVETNASTGFATHYVGWGCLSPVDVTVYLEDATTQHIEFDMCKSLGPDWVSGS